MKQIIVLLGGTSAERDISLTTGEEIYEALKKDNLKVDKYYLDKNILKFCAFLAENKDSIIVFNALHGKFGEDGRIQSILDFFGIPYTHSGVLTSAISMDKMLMKTIASSIKINCAKHQEIDLNNFAISNLKIPYPFVVKPVDEGSSYGIYLVTNEEDLQKVLTKVRIFKRVMIEEYIKGVECTVGVLESKALGVTEIIPKNIFYDYESKYSEGGSEHILPARIPEDIFNQMMIASENIFTTIRATGAIRVDFIYNKEEKKFYFLEVNNQPGMTKTSLLPEQAKYVGISFVDLCKRLINNAEFYY